jgi:hypothetical protein
MYVVGLTSNDRLKEEAADKLKQARRLHEETGRKITLFHSFYYQAGSWPCPRRVVARVEVSAEGRENIRFIATDTERTKASVLYRDIYAARGNCELYIKDHKLHTKSDRTSCRRFEANQFRLFLHSAAYVLLHTLKTEILRGTEFANATFETVRSRILKVRASVREMKTRVRVQVPENFPLKDLLIRAFRIFGTVHSPG